MGDRLISTQAMLETHILSFYERLYTRDEQVEANEEARQDCFQHLKQTVTEAHNKELLRLLTMEEVSTAMKQLLAGKSPRVDTIPAKFYQEMWEDIEFDIFNFVSESNNQTNMFDKMNVSKTTLLPKYEDRLRVHNYYPISLLNTLYKIIAKVYANRMKPFFHC